MTDDMHEQHERDSDNSKVGLGSQKHKIRDSVALLRIE